MPSKLKQFRRQVTDAITNVMTPLVVKCLGGCSDKCANKLANAAAYLIKTFRAESYKTILANLEVAFRDLDDKQRKELADRNLRHTARLAIECFRLLKHPEQFMENASLDNEEIKELAHNGAFIFALPHLGNWEVFGQAAPKTGIKSAAIAGTFRNQKLNQLIENARSANGLYIIPKEGAARKVLSALRNGYAVGFLPDQNLSPSEGGVFLEFFGLTAPSSILHAVLARRLGIPIFVGATIRDDNGKFSLEIEHLPKETKDYGSDLELAQDVLKASEKLIRKYPEQYLWNYKRWRHIPKNASDVIRQRFPYYAENKKTSCPQELLDKIENQIKQEK